MTTSWRGCRGSSASPTRASHAGDLNHGDTENTENDDDIDSQDRPTRV
jgi:hypothetical protein